MAMSVAENPVTQQLPRNPQQQLAITSTIGAVVVLAGLGFIFAALPMLWMVFWDAYLVTSLGLEKNDFLSSALLIMLELGVIGALVYGAYLLLQSQKRPGVRAGIVFAAIGIFAILSFAFWLGEVLNDQFEENATLGWIILGLVIGGLLAGLGYLFVAVPGWARFLEAVEEQGWFHGAAYKGNQGVRVRRGTILGILAVGGCGIFTAVVHGFFGSERTALSADWNWILNVGDKTTYVPIGNDWYWTVPFTGKLLCIPLMFKIHILLPVLLAVVLVWFAWRVVNMPAFADFLIATEAEMNKVSWTSRPRLIQDTIVVLVTVVLFTGFLFVVDILWIQILSAPGIQVLLIDTRKEQQKAQEKAQW